MKTRGRGTGHCLSPDTELKRANLERERREEEALNQKIVDEFFKVCVAARPVTSAEVKQAFANYRCWAKRNGYEALTD